MRSRARLLAHAGERGRLIGQLGELAAQVKAYMASGILPQFCLPAAFKWKMCTGVLPTRPISSGAPDG